MAEVQIRVKVKQRDKIEVIVGAVTGSIDSPEVVVCGRYRGSDLEIVGRTVPAIDRRPDGEPDLQ